jgi:PadR family transcriptional regulator PadR
MEHPAISSDLIRGHIDTIILHSLLNGDKFPQQISDYIEIKSEKNYQINQATLYSSLKRLESLNYVSSYWNDAENGRRKFYKITVYTSHPGEEEYEYYSTAVPAAMYQYARNMLEDYIHCAAMEYYWRDGKKWETEEQFYKRFRKRCGYYIEEVSKKEYFDQVKAIWRME